MFKYDRFYVFAINKWYDSGGISKLCQSIKLL